MSMSYPVLIILSRISRAMLSLIKRRSSNKLYKGSKVDLAAYDYIYCILVIY